MTELDLTALRAKAEAATPDEWRVWYEHAATEQQMKDALSEQVELTPEQDRCGGVYMIDAEGKCPALTGCGPNSKNNAEFLVSFQPRVVLALLDRVEKAEALAPPLDDYDEMHALEDENERLRALLYRAGEALRPIAEGQAFVDFSPARIITREIKEAIGHE